LEAWRSLPFRACIRKSTGQLANNSTLKSSKGKKKKKPGQNNQHFGEVKYGVQVPQSVREALLLDEEDDNTLWTDTMSKEICALNKLNCFRVQERANWNPRDEGYQYAPLHLIFDVKPDGRRKARLVVGGHVV
jgi:hypothetical protein